MAVIELYFLMDQFSDQVDLSKVKNISKNINFGSDHNGGLQVSVDTFIVPRIKINPVGI